MPAPQTLAAGALVAFCGAAVLLGWVFDVASAKSVMAGWRVMVPVSAASFVFAGIAIVLMAGTRSGQPPLGAARAAAAIGLALPLLTFVEYLTGSRTGVENWLGVAFDAASPVAGRMSPLTSASLVALFGSILGLTLRGARAAMVARIGTIATLMTAWLAILAVAFDTGRLADVPRFPGMAVMTILLIAVASWATLELSFARDDDPAQRDNVPTRFGAALIVAFVAPLLLGWVRDSTSTPLPPQVLTALLVFLLTGAMATIVWKYSARMAALRRERARAFAELEQRVEARTGELAARNDALRHSEDRLRDADRRKDEFLATLAHELRNPLAPIRSAVAVLRMDTVSDEDKQEGRIIIDRQVAQMARLIDDLLDVSRITAGKLPMRKRPLRLSEVLNLAIATVRPHVDSFRHRLTVSLPDEPILLEADEARLSQVFANLLHNACKYTEPGGEIVLTASLPNETEVVVAVHDNGIGIPAEFVPRLFDKFSQVAPALDRSQGGLGLGLSLVHGIVMLHGGRVEARSAGAGRGSEFIVSLPVLPAAQRPPTPDVLLPPEQRRNVSRRVLVVDDNTDSAESMALLLRLDGHLVETAHSGEKAIEIATRFEPDAILLDIGMPGMNGYEVCRRVRAMPWGDSVLMIAQTGWGQPADQARSREAGFDAHLTKPVDPAAVQELLLSVK